MNSTRIKPIEISNNRPELFVYIRLGKEEDNIG